MKDMLDSYPMPTGVNLLVSTVVHVTHIYYFASHLKLHVVILYVFSNPCHMEMDFSSNKPNKTETFLSFWSRRLKCKHYENTSLSLTL